MQADWVCVSCASRSLTLDGGTKVCLECGLRAAVVTEFLDYGAAYAGDESLYSEHIKMLDHFQTVEALRPLLLPFESRIVDRIGQRPDVHKVVDLGCGTGRFLRAVEATGVDARGYEIASVLVQRLRGHGRQVQQGGIDEFLATNEPADAVSLLEVVEHLTEPGAAIDRLLIQKQPKLLFLVVPEWHTRRRFDTRFALHDVPPNHLTWWNERSLRQLLGRHGYRASVEKVPERRKSLLGHIARNRHQPSEAGPGEWVRALANPPAFWLLGTAERT